MLAGGISHRTAVAGLFQIVEGQAVMLTTLNMFGAPTIVFAFEAHASDSFRRKQTFKRLLQNGVNWSTPAASNLLG